MPNYSHQTFPLAFSKIKANSSSDEETGCMIWHGHIAGEGYGVIRCDNEIWYIHRLIYREFICREVPQVVLHTCDTPRCWAKEHLVGGTHADNVNDKVAKGRHMFGTACHAAKLNDNKVRDIKASDLSVTQLAFKYDVARSQIIGILNGTKWKHVS